MIAFGYYRALPGRLDWGRKRPERAST